LASFHTLCESDEIYQLQYRFVNPLESDLNKFPKSISIIIFKPHGRPFEKINIELKHLPYKSNAEIQLDSKELRAENFKGGPKKIRFRDKYVEIHENLFFTYFLKSKH